MKLNPTHLLELPKNKYSEGIAGLMFRIPLGLYFLWAGAVKVFHIGPTNFANHAWDNANWLTFFPHEIMPQSMHMMYLTALPFLELIVGITLILGLFTPLSAFGIAMMLISIMVGATLQKTLDKPITTMPPFDSNIIFTFLSFGVLLTGGGIYKLDSLINPWLKKQWALFKDRKSNTSKSSTEAPAY